ncbi:MAG: GerMN domain-containing protein [candidate division NC10 bacterium]|nr:GerMN domain-containing protein [candidate division NC10 bacterium]
MSGAVRQPVLWPWVSLLVGSLGVTGAIAWHVWPRLPDQLTVGPRQAAVQRHAQQPPAVQHQRIRLFFPQEAGDALKEQEREIPRRPTLEEQVRAVLRELAVGGLPGSRPPLPAGIEVRQVFLDAFGIVYLDFGKGFQSIITAPGAQPELVVSAIATTLTSTFSEIKRVQLLVESQELTVAAGGLDLRRPVGPRFPGEENPPVVSQPRE